jgi:hypothetical protein
MSDALTAFLGKSLRVAYGFVSDVKCQHNGAFVRVN